MNKQEAKFYNLVVSTFESKGFEVESMPISDALEHVHDNRIFSYALWITPVDKEQGFLTMSEAMLEPHRGIYTILANKALNELYPKSKGKFWTTCQRDDSHKGLIFMFVSREKF